MRKTWIAMVLLAALTVPAGRGQKPQPSAHYAAGDWNMEETVAHVLPSLVLLDTYDVAGERTGSGSGFIVRSDGWIVTNFHVIDDSARVAVKTVHDVHVSGSRLRDSRGRRRQLLAAVVESPTACAGER